MRARKRFEAWIVFLLAFCASCCLAGEEPRLSAAEVIEAANAKARDEGYDTMAYFHYAPYYFKTQGVWDVSYYYKARKAGEVRATAFAVAVDDTTGFVSLFPRISPVAATPASSEGMRSTGPTLWRTLAFCLLLGASMRFVSWLAGNRFSGHGQQ
jgi:hypothetical protein